MTAFLHPPHEEFSCKLYLFYLQEVSVRPAVERAIENGV